MGIETEDYNLAIDKYALVDDEYVLRRTEEVDRCIGEELRQRLI